MYYADSTSTFSADTEVRHLRSYDRRYLAEQLDALDRWKDLAAILPKPDGESGLLLSSSNIRKLEQQKTVHNGSPTQALLEYWGTKGRKRPVIRDLICYLKCCKFYVAAEYVAVNILKSDSILDSTGAVKNAGCASKLIDEANSYSKENNSKVANQSFIAVSQVSPTAPNLSALSIEDNNAFDELAALVSSSSEIVQFEYSKLVEVTNGFSDTPLKSGGYKIGAGAFGSVYKALLPKFPPLAVKRISAEFSDQFLTELNVLMKFKHENLLNLLGFSHDGSVLCLVYEFMSNGSLQDRLACLDGTPPLSWSTRINITQQACDGICYLHTFDSKPYIHRDIKSANILLDCNLNAKVGDFGLTKIGSDSLSTTKSCIKTANIIGTSVYMAPEAFRGEVSVKLDTFSFGVVMLELATGLPAFDPQREEADIISHLEENLSDDDDIREVDIERIGDPRIQISTAQLVKYLKIAQLATEQRKKNRPTMQLVAEYLKNNFNE